MKNKKKEAKKLKQPTSLKSTNRNIDQLATLIERQIKQLTANLKNASKLKGRDKMQTLQQLKRKNFKSLKNLVNSYQIAIATEQAENQLVDVSQYYSQHKKFQITLEQIRKDLQFFQTEKVRQTDIYAQRAAAATTTKEQYEFKIQAAQKQSETAVKNMLKMLVETNQIANTVNIELERQINELDNVDDNLRDTETLMNRAMRHINYFARSIYTDKLLMALMVLILLAVVAIVILNIMGKVSTSNKDLLV